MFKKCAGKVQNKVKHVKKQVDSSFITRIVHARYLFNKSASQKSDIKKVQILFFSGIF